MIEINIMHSSLIKETITTTYIRVQIIPLPAGGCQPFFSNQRYVSFIMSLRALKNTTKPNVVNSIFTLRAIISIQFDINLLWHTTEIY